MLRLPCVGGPDHERELSVREGETEIPINDRRGVQLGTYQLDAGLLKWKPTASFIVGVHWRNPETLPLRIGYALPPENLVFDPEGTIWLRRIDNPDGVTVLQLVWPAYEGMPPARRAQSAMLLVEVPTSEIDAEALCLLRVPAIATGEVGSPSEQPPTDARQAAGADPHKLWNGPVSDSAGVFGMEKTRGGISP